MLILDWIMTTLAISVSALLRITIKSKRHPNLKMKFILPMLAFGFLSQCLAKQLLNLCVAVHCVLGRTCTGKLVYKPAAHIAGNSFVIIPALALSVAFFCSSLLPTVILS